MTLIDFYERDIKSLPPGDRLKLASLILNDITTPAADSNALDVREEWGGKDYEEFSAATWQHVETQSGMEPRNG